jgi:hypothetical protein
LIDTGFPKDDILFKKYSKGDAALFTKNFILYGKPHKTNYILLVLISMNNIGKSIGMLNYFLKHFNGNIDFEQLDISVFFTDENNELYTNDAAIRKYNSSTAFIPNEVQELDKLFKKIDKNSFGVA